MVLAVNAQYRFVSQLNTIKKVKISSSLNLSCVWLSSPQACLSYLCSYLWLKILTFFKVILILLLVKVMNKIIIITWHAILLVNQGHSQESKRDVSVSVSRCLKVTMGVKRMFLRKFHASLKVSRWLFFYCEILLTVLTPNNISGVVLCLLRYEVINHFSGGKIIIFSSFLFFFGGGCWRGSK